MAHKHSVYDTDPHFKIDKVTRNIVDQSQVKKVLMQGDHNSERYTFEMPRYIDGHDMMLCDLIEVHYLNIDANTRAENRGVYVVDDLTMSENVEDLVIFSWLISSNVTKISGSLSFLIRFACTENGKVVYAWNTGINKDKSISMSMYNSDTVIEEFPDAIAQLIASIETKLNKSGHIPNKYLGTDEQGNIVEKDGSGGGVSDYTQLTNKPQIGGVELTGDKSLLELGIQPEGDYIQLPKTISGSADSGIAGQFAVSDGQGGIKWHTIINGNEVSY